MGLYRGRIGALLQILWMSSGAAMFHQLNIKNDQRALFKIETFCFEEGGNMDIDVTEFVVRNRADGAAVAGVRAGFLMVKTNSESELQKLLEESVEENTCVLDGTIFRSGERSLVIDMSQESGSSSEGGRKATQKATRHRTVHGEDSEGQHRSHDRRGSDSAEGLYSLIFARCDTGGADHANGDNVAVDFQLRAAFWNPGPNYLSACEAPLPKLYLSFALLFGAAAAAWAYVLGNGGGQVHTLMLVLAVVKFLTLLLDSIRFHFLALTGSAEGWSAVFYVLSFCKSLLLFTVIILIGTGWSLVKPFLNDKEKQIILVVGVLQVLDNVALVVLDEMSPGSQTWYTWRDVLHLVDIACCCAILFPIVWSIRSLRQAAAADGKAEHNLMKLTLFRQFYIMVVTYIYFTRIVVFLLAATMPFDLLWLRFGFTELASLAFYLVTGFKFKPGETNPYLPVNRADEHKENEENASEFGLPEEEEERSPARVAD